MVTRAIPNVAKSTVAVLLALLVALQLIKSIYQRRADSEARAWYVSAKNAASATWTEDNATSWFKKHGFTKIMAGEGSKHGSNGSIQRYRVVTGNLQIDPGGPFASPKAVIIEFIFGMDHQFQRVQYQQLKN